MSELADAVLPLIRTRADLHRWSASNAHGAQMHEAVDLLEEAARSGDPAVLFSVTQRAIASALKADRPRRSSEPPVRCTWRSRLPGLSSWRIRATAQVTRDRRRFVVSL